MSSSQPSASASTKRGSTARQGFGHPAAVSTHPDECCDRARVRGNGSHAATVRYNDDSCATTTTPGYARTPATGCELAAEGACAAQVVNGADAYPGAVAVEDLASGRVVTLHKLLLKSHHDRACGLE